MKKNRFDIFFERQLFFDKKSDKKDKKKKAADL